MALWNAVCVCVSMSVRTCRVCIRVVQEECERLTEKQTEVENEVHRDVNAQRVDGEDGGGGGEVLKKGRRFGWILPIK